ncbi:MAG TPA: hypothetical protein VN706_16005 [Gemmatimonadaceae bacterium]|nr:hypothetical protein [Gemmatimonadaceae bacterium]
MPTTANVKSHGSPDIEAQAREQISKLLVRSATDKNLRNRLLTQPNAAYTEATGNVLPENVQLKFIENRGGPTIVLPAFADAGSPLGDIELEMVSGGSEPLTIAGLVFLGTAAFAVGAWATVKVLEAVSN